MDVKLFLTNDTVSKICPMSLNTGTLELVPEGRHFMDWVPLQTHRELGQPSVTRAHHSNVTVSKRYVRLSELRLLIVYIDGYSTSSSILCVILSMLWLDDFLSDWFFSDRLRLKCSSFNVTLIFIDALNSCLWTFNYYQNLLTIFISINLRFDWKSISFYVKLR